MGRRRPPVRRPTVSKKTEPTPAVRAIQADAREDYAKHQEPNTATASATQHNDLRANASANAGFRGRRQ
jgi:hypothetical protein